jgi:hypothetical protein
MTSFLVEVYAPGTTPDVVDSLAKDVTAAAEGLTREGTPVRYVRSIFLPEDETCLLLFEAHAREDVLAAVGRAGLPGDYLSVAIVQAGTEPGLPAVPG